MTRKTRLPKGENHLRIRGPKQSLPFNEIPTRATYRRFSAVGWKVIEGSVPVSHNQGGEAVYARKQCEKR